MYKFLTLIFSCLILFSCAAQETESYKIISSQEFEKRTNPNNVLIIDVRTPLEFAQGHLENAINIDITDPNFNAKIKAFDKNEPMYIYCKSGGRSGNAGKIMLSLGFKEIYDLQGGISNWGGKTTK